MDFAIRSDLNQYLQDQLQDQVFDMDINTDYLNRSITASYEDYDFTEDVQSDRRFVDVFDAFIEEAKTSRAGVYKRGLIDGDRLNQSLLRRSYVPTKSKVMALGLGLALSKDQLVDLLASAGYNLSEVDKRDHIVVFFIERGFYDVAEINTYLKYYKELQLGDV